MKNKLIIGTFLAISFLFSTSVFASGKLTLENAYRFKLHKMSPVLGLSVYQPLVLGLGYNMWTGIGSAASAGDPVYWAASRHDLNMYWGKWVFATGVTLRYSKESAGDLGALYGDHDVHVSVARQLW